MVVKTKLAIACQGGGSHTAFTAGVLKKLLERNIYRKYKLVGFSGTSGGALCATLVWIGLLELAKGRPGPVYQRLLNFWRANTAISAWERALNNFTTQLLRLQDAAMIPAYAPNPYSQQGTLQGLMLMNPRKEYLDFQRLLNNHIPFARIPSLIESDSPRLLLGAVDVISGNFKAFDSQKGEISIEAVRASAAIPNVFTGVRIGDGVYWDGLFSENPPISDFLISDRELMPQRDRPDELWVILVNPKERDTEPTTPPNILDRRNELAGNLSLFQEVRFIESINTWIEQGSLKPEFISQNQLKPIKVRYINMSREVADSLDYVSKLDRSPAFIEMLIAEGEARGEDFLNRVLSERARSAAASPRRPVPPAATAETTASSPAVETESVTAPEPAAATAEEVSSTSAETAGSSPAVETESVIAPEPAPATAEEVSSTSAETAGSSPPVETESVAAPETPGEASTPRETGSLSTPESNIRSVLFFNGTNGKVEIPHKQILNPLNFTIEAWAKVTGGNSYGSVVTSRNDPTQQGYILYATPSNTWEFWLGHGTQWSLVCGPSIERNVWTHLAGSCDRESQIMRFYINGKEVGYSSGVNFQANELYPLRIGAGATERLGDYWFYGEIAEVRLWDSARSPEAIAADMFSPPAATEPGLLGYWPLDEGVETTIFDETDNANHGTLSGNAFWVESQLPGEISE